MPPKRTTTPMSDAAIKALVKGTDILSYTQRFQELALMCERMFLEEYDQVEKYVGGLPDMIQGSVIASKPKTMQEEIEIDNDLMDQKKVGHLARDYRSPAATANNQRALEANQRVVTCFKDGVQGQYKKDCPKLKNNNRGNRAGNGRATARAYTLGNTGKNSDANVVMGLAGYYQRFIKVFLKNAKSMTKLTQEKVMFDWGDKQEAAFQILKEKLCSAPILALPEGAKDL
nr:putative reverse transcriptase domain-containing protein [Tanacetum cinerariifolium]